MSQLDKLKDKFKSCNDVPVSSIRVSIEEFERLLAEIGERKQYFVHGPDDCIAFFNVSDDALTCANEIVQNYLDTDEGWNEDVEHVVVGLVTHRATKCDVTYPVGELNEDGEDEEGEYWGDFKYRCNYKML